MQKNFPPLKGRFPCPPFQHRPSPAPSAQITANQENAQLSTGPKSPEGKQRSSQNASSHRIFAPHLLQPGESPSAYHAFREPLLHDLFPQGFLELASAERIISLHWQLQRLQSAQYHLIAAHHQQYQKRLEDQQEILENKRDRHLANCEEMGIDCSEEDLQNIGLGQPDPDAPPSLPDPGYFLAQSLLTSRSSGSRLTVEERLLNIESKLHTLLSKAQKHYDHLQKTRQQKEQADSQKKTTAPTPTASSLLHQKPMTRMWCRRPACRQRNLWCGRPACRLRNLWCGRPACRRPRQQ